jgi:hypothetical protein
MGSHNHTHIITLEEFVYSVYTKLHDVVLPIGVSNGIWGITQIFFILRWIAPQEVQYQLLFRGGCLSKVYFTWSLYLLYVV